MKRSIWSTNYTPHIIYFIVEVIDGTEDMLPPLRKVKDSTFYLCEDHALEALNKIKDKDKNYVIYKGAGIIIEKLSLKENVDEQKTEGSEKETQEGDGEKTEEIGEKKEGA